MKKALLIILVFVLTNTFAQNNIIKTDLFSKSYGLTYEHAKKHHSFTFGVSLYKDGDIDGGLFEVGYRYYFSNEMLPKGFYISPLLGGGSFDYFDRENLVTYTASTGLFKLVGGHQWIFGKHFALDLNLGYYSMAVDYENTPYKYEYSGITGSLGIGYAW